MKMRNFRSGWDIVFCSVLIFMLCFCVSAEEVKNEIDQTIYRYGTYSDYLKNIGAGQDSKQISLHEFLTIEEVNLKRPALGTYETIGFVAKEYTCPECPKDSICKPCQGNYIVISEEATEYDFSSLMDKQMILFTDHGLKLKTGKKYRFVIKALDVKTTSQPINNFKLIYAQKI